MYRRINHGNELTPLYNKNSRQILVLDEDFLHSESIRLGLLLFGHVIEVINDQESLIEVLRDRNVPQPDVLLIDMTSPGRGWEKVIDETRDRKPNLPIVALCGFKDHSALQAARDKGIPTLVKPFDPKTLHLLIEKTLETFRN